MLGSRNWHTVRHCESPKADSVTCTYKYRSTVSREYLRQESNRVVAVPFDFQTSDEEGGSVMVGEGGAYAATLYHTIAVTCMRGKQQPKK